MLFNKFFSDCLLVAKIQVDKVVRWCRDGDFGVIFVSCIFIEPLAAHFRHAF